MGFFSNYQKHYCLLIVVIVTDAPLEKKTENQDKTFKHFTPIVSSHVTQGQGGH